MNIPIGIKPKALIMGISGQDGSLLAEFLLDKGYQVYGTTRRTPENGFERHRYLLLNNKIKIYPISPSDTDAIFSLLNDIKVDEIYMLSAQSSVSNSLSNVAATFDSIIGANISLCEALKKLSYKPKSFFASTSEVFGHSSQPVSLDTPVAPLNPYAIAKSAANNILRFYRDQYGIPISIGHMFNHESELRGGQYVTRKIALAACKAMHESYPLELGNIDVVRDWGSAREFVGVMWLSLQIDSDKLGENIICTGTGRSLRDLVARMYANVGLDWMEHVKISQKFIRNSDPSIIIGDPSGAINTLNWKHQFSFEDTIDDLMDRTKLSLDRDW